MYISLSFIISNYFFIGLQSFFIQGDIIGSLKDIGLAFYLFIINQPFSGSDIVNLNQGIIEIENITLEDKFNSNNLNKEVDLVKDKLFTYLLVN